MKISLDCEIETAKMLLKELKNSVVRATVGGVADREALTRIIENLEVMDGGEWDELAAEAESSGID
ncbi:MAG: hypothetical protein LBT88_02530, partial [Oscillospiraceae bacterium]|nr:hypothetical protein [Oscillospiraceae bacterium]